MKAEDLCNDVPKGRPKAHVLESKQARTNQYIPVNTKELQEAETEIIKSVQREAFQEEISLLSSMSTRWDSQDRTFVRAMKKTSAICKLDLFLDENGVLRVGGRLKHANLTAAAKHPVILPKRGHVTSLIISHCHDSVEHQGCGMTHNRVRSFGFWINGASSAISDFIAKCVLPKVERSGTGTDQRLQ